MSADQWQTCPACGANEDNEGECEGLREEFETFIEDGIIYFRYNSRCVDCGFQIRWNPHMELTLPKNVKPEQAEAGGV